MKRIDRKELNNATIVAYALGRALFDELEEPVKRRVIESALRHLPPQPDPNDTPPADIAMWRDARLSLKNLGARS
jgi:hypothetical protein